MKFDAAQITRLARDTGFLADNLEKFRACASCSSNSTNILS
jgi:hypothetical protein